MRRMFCCWVAGLLLVLGAAAVVQAEDLTVKDLPTLKEAVKQITDEMGRSDVLYDDAPVIAYEENKQFIAATLDLSDIEAASTSDGQPIGTRRVIVLSPSLLLVNDRFIGESPESVGVCSTVLQKAVDGDATHSLKAGNNCTTVATPDRVYRLALPKGRAGYIIIEDAEGETVLAKRPLPSGILPHGPEGAAMIERWDRAYRDGKTPPWDAGSADEELVRVVEEGIVKPCKTAVLGCGSGTNAIYLASKGFDVTAIDVAPTALSIAEEKARKAGVHVDWVLADVLNLPDMEPFDLVFDRGCYHNVRYVDAEAFLDGLQSITKPGSRSLILSLNRQGPPGVHASHMEEDFADGFDIEWMEESGIAIHGEKSQRKAWSLMLKTTD